MNCFTAVMTVSLLEKWCPCSLSFIGPNRSKSEGTKSGLYGRCGKTVHPRLAMSITVTKLVWSLALLYCKGKAVFFSGLTLEVWAFQFSQCWDVVVRVDGLCRFWEIEKDQLISPFLSLKKESFISWGLHLEHFFSDFHVTTPWIAIWFWLLVVTLRVVTSNDAIKKTVTFSLVLIQ